MHRRVCWLGVFAFIVARLCVPDAVLAQGRLKEEGKLVLSFPLLSLAAGERIVAFRLTVTYGSISSISNIPKDWSLDLVADPSWQPKLSGRCSHGAGALFNPSDLPTVTVEPANLNGTSGLAFRVEATVETTVDFEKIKSYSFDQAQLVRGP